MGGMNDCCARSQRFETLQQFNRPATIGGLALFNFRDLFTGMNMQRKLMEVTIVRDGAKPFPRHGTYGVRRYAKRNASHAQRLDAGKVCVVRSIAEAPLFFLRGQVETALGVGGHEQYDTDTCLSPGLQNGF